MWTGLQLSAKTRYVVVVIFSLLTALLPARALAEAPLAPRLVIIDTGIDSSMPIFQNHLILELCIMDWYTCPNGTNFQSGAGAATPESSIITLNGFDHGTQMAAIALKEMPTLEFIFIRIVGNNRNGVRLSVSDNVVLNALDWVKTNAKVYNIKAVAMSQGHHLLMSATKYCPPTPLVEKKIIELKFYDIPIFLPAGNGADKKHIDWPACIPAAIAVGAINNKNQITSYTNMDRTLSDFYVLGDVETVGPAGAYRNASGTSVSTQIAATKWLALVSAFPDKSYSQIYTAFRSSGTMVFDKSYRYGRKMEIDKASTAITSLIP